VYNQGLIDGKWIDAKSGATISVLSALVNSVKLVCRFAHRGLDPATGEELGTVPEMGLEETKEAIDAAGRSFATWSKTTAKVMDHHPKMCCPLT
jgi:succinate-semialdehyde dehydrogenase/glutarate-semialdehyde dehydrogenase